MTVSVRPIGPADRDRIRALTIEHWGSEIAVAHGVAYEPAILPGFVAEMAITSWASSPTTWRVMGARS